MGPRNVELSADNIVRCLEREWFPKTLGEIAHLFSASIVDVINVMPLRDGRVVWYLHPTRNQVVYTTPRNPHFRALTARDATPGV